ncbi:MAG: sigma-70 family RNA polymerase sigma factor [Peptoniphilus sp.]|nr:sigma-70 family RNA polymerase sigma factor [Peptoniphilus sp.]MDD7363593.1 sigma-70 family RNA polymerase sigma factor [Bacillota bacterium]MDY6045216.1 sigma-70 family RNA polymerase sigma factor [Peptoniphilus sp.]
MNCKELVNRLKRRDEDALYSFIEDYGAVLKGVVSKTLWKYPYLWDEALNDTLLSVWENIRYYDETRSSFKNWCAVIAKYKSIDLIRKEIKHESVDIDDAPVAEQAPLTTNLEIEEALSALNDADRELFKDIFIDSLSYKEAAEKENITLENAYKRVSRGRKFLNMWRREKP